MRQTFTESLSGNSSTKRLPFWLLLCCFLPASAWAQLSVSLTPTNLTCFGANNGGVVATASGGTSPYTYAWSNGGNTAAISNLAAGVYTVTVTDASGATVANLTTVNQPAQLTALTTQVQTQICDIVPDGIAGTVAGGGTAPYTYLWSNGATTAQITGLAAGNYTVTVTDANGCTVTGSALVEYFPEGLWLADSTINTCPGTTNGFIHISVMSGTGPYTFQWNTGATSQDLFNLAPGTYTVTVTDANGCQGIWSATVGTAANNLGVEVITTTQICDIAPDGTAAAVPFNGTPPYTYVWSTGATTAQIGGLAAGTYSVTVTDASGCTGVGQGTVTFWNEGLWLMDNTVNVTCFGLSNGSATIMAMSGTPPYTYQWSNGATGSMIFNLAPGTYSVTVTDANGCSAQWPIVISQPPALTVTATVTAGACGLNGTATVTASGGVGPYTYLWSTGSTNSTISAGPGTYTVTLTDANGCTATTQAIIISAGGSLGVTANATGNAGCITGGAAAATASGGSGNYTFVWSNGQSGAAIANIPAGNYTVTATDVATGCTGTASVVILAGVPNLTATIQVLAYANCTTGGSATVNVVGGAAPFTYQWSNGGNTQNVSNLVAGLVGVTVTDATGCVGTDTAVINQLNGPTVTVQLTAPATCLTGASATATASGGTAPYTYLWTNGQTTATATNLGAGTQTVTVTDAGGCAASASIAVTTPMPPTVTITAVTNALCNQAGSATASVSGGTGPYTYAWSNGETTAAAVNLTGGNYTVTVTDASGCTATAAVTITQSNNGVTIGDFVWYDNDQDGFQAPLEITNNGVANISVMLQTAGPDGAFGTADDVTVATTTTNAQGLYQFTCVTPGTYVLMFGGLPATYQWTSKNAVFNDCLDSDVNSNGKTDPFVITAGQPNNLCFDAGIHTICIPLLHPGVVCCNQTICPGETPTLLYEVQPPMGGSGALQYLWMQLVQMGPGGPTWVGIPGATQQTYQPGPLFETSYFMRCVRRAGCETFLESNIIQITVLPSTSPDCSPFLINLSVVPMGPTAVQVNWTTAPEAATYMYTVQHSTDQQTWTSVSAVMGHQQTGADNSYSVVDASPSDGMNYYRIKRSSALGGDEYSVAQQIELKSSGILVFPNPIEDVLNIRSLAKFDADLTVEIVTPQGQILETVHIAQGAAVQHSIPTGNLPEGLYLVRIRAGKENIRTMKVTKY